MRKIIFFFVIIFFNASMVFANYGHTAGWPGNEEDNPSDNTAVYVVAVVFIVIILLRLFGFSSGKKEDKENGRES